MTIWRIAIALILVIAVVFLIARVGLQMQADYLEKIQHRQAQLDKEDAEFERQRALKFPLRRDQL